MKPVRLMFLFLPVIVLSFLGSCARVPVKETSVSAPVPLPPGKIRGKIVLTGISVSMEGAEVRIGDVKSLVNRDGAFSLPDASPGKQTLVIEKTFSSGNVRRVLGLSTLYIGDAPIETSVKVSDATDVDVFCLDCHPPLKKITRKDQIFRDVHISGVVAKRATTARELLDKDGKITCESCHTVHGQGKFSKYGVDDLKSGVFCNRCHGSP